MSDNQKQYLRFSIAQRAEHFLLVLSFGALVLTGLPQKFSSYGLAEWMIALFGGIESIRIIHRAAAFIMALETVYHIVVLGYKVYVLRVKNTLIPVMKDGQDALGAFLHNIGMAKQNPRMPRYNFAEKAEYWAMIWGTVIMGLTGFMLWNPITVSKILPGQFIPAAKAAHGGEAVLAALAIVVWHFYNVHLKHWSWAMIKGLISHEAMEDEHAGELDEIEAGQAGRTAAAAEVQQRKKLYIPVAAVSTVVMLVAIYFLAFGEQTALATIKPVSAGVVAYVPQTRTPRPTNTPTPIPTATPTPAPTSAAPTQAVAASGPAWTTGISALFDAKCKSCHGAMGNASFESYAAAMKGGSKGPSILPGKTDDSLLVQMMAKGDHMGNFAPDELQKVKDWIKAGAPEKPAGGAAAPAAPAAGAGPTWASVSPLFDAKCKSCHGAMGGASFESYAAAMKGGSKGPSILPGKPDDSLLVKTIAKGDHMGNFAPDELEKVKAWIKAGALEK